MEPLAVFDENLRDARRLLDLYDTVLTRSKKDVKTTYMERVNRSLGPAAGRARLVNRSDSEAAYIIFKESSPIGWRDLRHSSLRPLLRMAHVQAVSAMDCYFHDQVKWHFGRILSTCADKSSKALRRFRIPVGGVKGVVDTYTNTTVGLRNLFQAELRKMSIQKPSSIERTLQIIGVTSVWSQTAQNVGVDVYSLQAWLNEIAHRRNMIVHEGDRKALDNGQPSTEREIRRSEVADDIHVIECFVYGIHDVIESEATS